MGIENAKKIALTEVKEMIDTSDECTFTSDECTFIVEHVSSNKDYWTVRIDCRCKNRYRLIAFKEISKNRCVSYV